MALTQIESGGIKDDAVTAGKIPANAVGSSEIADNAITQAQIAGASIDEAKMNISNAGSNGQYLQKQSGNTGGLTWADVPAGVGGGTGLDVNDNVKIRLGTGNDLEIYHDGSDSRIHNTGTGNLIIKGDDVHIQGANGENMANFNEDAGVQLRYDGTTKFDVTSAGVDVTGRVTADDLTVENTSGNLSAMFTATNGLGTLEVGGSTGAFIDLKTPVSDDFDLRVESSGTLTSVGNINFTVQGNETGARILGNGACELYHDNVKKFETSAAGATITGNLIPEANNTRDLGSAANAWANIHTNDLHLSNEGSVNDVDGTWGKYTIQEGEDDLFLINKRSGKKYKFNLTEVS